MIFWKWRKFEWNLSAREILCRWCQRERERERERMKCQSKDKKYFCFRRKIIFVETQFYFYRFPSFCPPSHLAPPQQQDSHSHSRSQRQSSSFWKLVRAAVFFWAAEPGFKKVSSALLKDTGYCPVDTNSTYFQKINILTESKTWILGRVDLLVP